MTVPVARKERTHLFWRHAAAWCAECRTHVPGRIVSEGPRVFLERACPRHGHARGLVSESREHFLERSTTPAATARPPGARRPDPAASCPGACGPCSWHEGAIRRLLVPLGDDGRPAAGEAAVRELIRRLEEAGDPPGETVRGEAAAGEAFLRIGRTDPDDRTLAGRFAAASLRPGIRRAWFEATGGLPLDALERRVAKALGLGADAFRPDPAAPLCLSLGPAAGGAALVLHAPMTADTLDLTRLVACPIWTVETPDRIAPACWATIRRENAP
jgi:hypothetical protein